MLRPEPSSPPRLLKELYECRLFVGWELGDVYMALDILAVGVAYSNDPPVRAHHAGFIPLGTFFDKPARKDCLVTLSIS